mmetsp:Transcript_145604/g.363157  ORF Transcript_145604/g.363157 Transcript_145604/m.363157 type:complete len:291 (+) Transcript_145604:803-1675(+)
MGVRVEEAVMEDLMAMDIKEQSCQPRPVERAGHLFRRPLGCGCAGHAAHATAEQPCREVASFHRHNEHLPLPLADLTHVHGSLYGLVGHVDFRHVFDIHLLLQLLCCRAVHLGKNLHQLRRVLPDRRPLQSLHCQNLAGAQRSHRQSGARWMHHVYGQRDRDSAAEVGQHVARHLAHNGRLFRVVELLRKLTLHSAKHLFHLFAHPSDAHGERHGRQVHLKILLHLWILYLDSHLGAICEDCKMNLAYGSGGDGLLIEILEHLAQRATQLGFNNVLDNREGLPWTLVQQD